MERNCPQCGNTAPPAAGKCSVCGADYEGPGVRSSPEKIEQLLIGGRKIDALKLYREEKGVGLKEAKEAVERIEQELRAQGRLPQVSGRGCVSLLIVILSCIALLEIGLYMV